MVNVPSEEYVLIWKGIPMSRIVITGNSTDLVFSRDEKLFKENPDNCELQARAILYGGFEVSGEQDIWCYNASSTSDYLVSVWRI